jgi:hypothetical protein
MNAVEKHPQRQQIIERILAGESMRSIGATVVPPVHHTSVARFRLKALGKATRTMRGKSPEVLSLKELSLASGANGNAFDGIQAVSEQLRSELHNAVEADRERLRKYLADAEAAQFVDPVTGEVSHNMDHGALARHIRNSLSSIELRARLSGLLQDGAGVAVNVAIAVAASPVQDEPVGITVEMIRK